MNSNNIYHRVVEELHEHEQADNLPVSEVVSLVSAPDYLEFMPLKFRFALAEGTQTKGASSFAPEVIIFDEGIRTTCRCQDYQRQRSCHHITQALRLICQRLSDLGLRTEPARRTEEAPAPQLEPEPPLRREGEFIVELDYGFLPPDLETKMYRSLDIELKGLQISDSSTIYTLEEERGEIITLTHTPGTMLLLTHCTCGSNGDFGTVCAHTRFALKHLRDEEGSLAFSREEQEEFKTFFMKEYNLSEEDRDRIELVVTPEGEIGCQVMGGYVLHNAKQLLQVLPPDEEEEGIHADYTYGNLLDLPQSDEPMMLCFIFFEARGAVRDILPCMAKRGRDGLPVNRFTPFSEDEFFNVKDTLTEEEQRLVSGVLLASPEREDYEGYSAKHVALIRRFSSLVGSTPCYRSEIGTGRSITRKRLEPIIVREQAAEVAFTIQPTEESGDLLLVPHIEIGEQRLELGRDQVHWSEYGLLLSGSNFHPWASEIQLKMMLYVQERESIRILASNAQEILTALIPALSRYHRIYDERGSNQATVQPECFERELYFSEESAYIRLLPIARYGEYRVPLYSLEQLFDGRGRRILRDLEGEAEYLSLIQSLHPRFAETRGVCFLEPKHLLEGDWMLHTSRMLERKGINLYGTQDLKSFRLNINSPSFSFGLSSGTDWFDLNIKVSFGKQQVSLQEIKRSLLNRSRYVQLGDGTLGILPEEWVRRLNGFLRVGEVKKDQVRLSPYQFNILDELAESIELHSTELEEMLERKHRLQHLGQVNPIAVPKSIQAKLRDYQQEGLNWLAFLEENKLGGCLADDMGLGKTLQTITFLAYLKETKQMQEPHLVITPTSLVFNWESELQKFAPSLSFLRYTGGERKQIANEEWEQADIVLTTYGTLINDIETLSKRTFGYVILDEAQAIKNPASKRYKAVRLLNCRGRLSLTGTPIENNTFDLYTQMTFLNPGLLGGMEHFRREFALPIDRDRNEEVGQLLSRMIHPFLLRRTKKQVATELPDKVEAIIYCEMGADQRFIYEQTKERIRTQLLSLVDEQGEQKSQIQVLQGLMQLRQICNSPALIDGHKQPRHTAPSVKIDMLLRKLHDLVGEHKVLVFSQFTSMLSLIADRLSEEGISYTYLDGSSSNRQELVEEFQQDETQRVFLISLKAGGTGLNLTAADYVFLIDPWWNPAVENQAIDRCYRIGQDKQVMAYRMICKDSIEEKILKLQEGKREVSESIIQTDLEHKHFDREQIASLFA